MTMIMSGLRPLDFRQRWHRLRAEALWIARHPAVLPVLMILLVADVLVILVHVAQKVALALAVLPARITVLDLNTDHSFGEWLNYHKWFVIALALFVVALKRRDRLSLSLGIIFLMILIDDSAQLHERIGLYLAQALSLPDDLLAARPEDWGALLVFGIMGLIAMALLAQGWRHRRAENRPFLSGLLLALIGLGFCGVALDLLHVSINFTVSDSGAGNLLLRGMTGLAEDGGEMIFASLAAAVALANAVDALIDRSEAGRRDDRVRPQP